MLPQKKVQIGSFLEDVKGDFNGFSFGYSQQFKKLIKENLVTLQGLRGRVLSIEEWVLRSKNRLHVVEYYDFLNQIETEIEKIERIKHTIYD